MPSDLELVIQTDLLINGKPHTGDVTTGPMGQDLLVNLS